MPIDVLGFSFFEKLSYFYYIDATLINSHPSIDKSLQCARPTIETTKT
jgi:hypothetical protein